MSLSLDGFSLTLSSLADEGEWTTIELFPFCHVTITLVGHMSGSQVQEGFKLILSEGCQDPLRTRLADIHFDRLVLTKT